MSNQLRARYDIMITYIASVLVKISYCLNPCSCIYCPRVCVHLYRRTCISADILYTTLCWRFTPQSGIGRLIFTSGVVTPVVSSPASLCRSLFLFFLCSQCPPVQFAATEYFAILDDICTIHMSIVPNFSVITCNFREVRSRQSYVEQTIL